MMTQCLTLQLLAALTGITSAYRSSFPEMITSILSVSLLPSGIRMSPLYIKNRPIYSASSNRETLELVLYKSHADSR